MTTEQLESLLEQINVQYHKYQHPPLVTCEDADLHLVERDGLRLKNLFLRDNYGRRHFLLLTFHDKQVDLKQLSRDLQISRIGFASNERLDKYLRVKPGCVSLLALIHDIDNAVEFWIDKEVWHHEVLLAHPFINTETLALARADIERFVQYTGHPIHLIEVPSKRS